MTPKRCHLLQAALLTLLITLCRVAGADGQQPEQRTGAYREHEARALTDLAREAAKEGKPGDALAFHLEALAIYRQIGARSGAAATLFEMGQINNELFNYEGAVARLVEAAAIYRELGAAPELARVNLALGRSQMMLGRRLDAIQVLEEALPEFTRTGNTRLAEEARRLLDRIR